MLYLGIDQHRKQLTVNLRNEQGEVVLKRQVSTGWDRVRKFFDDLRRQAAGGFMAVVEVCGFNDGLLKMLDEYGCRETVVIQPEKRSKKKTDRRDASQLAELLWVNRDRLLAGRKVSGLRRVLPPTEEDAQDRQLTTLRKRLVQLRPMLPSWSSTCAKPWLSKRWGLAGLAGRAQQVTSRWRSSEMAWRSFSSRTANEWASWMAS